MELCILLIILGICFIVSGIFAYKNPDFAWEHSRKRIWYVEGGKPSEIYYEHQKLSSMFSVLIGILLIFFTSLFMLLSIEKYVVEINGNELKLPCSYSDIEALGFTIDSDKEICILGAKDATTYKAVNAAGEEIEIMFDNNGDAEKLATDCKVTAIYVNAESGPDIKLPNGVEFGMRESQVEAIMGDVSGFNENYEETVGFKTYEISVGYHYTNYTNQDNNNTGSGIVLFTSSYNRDEKIAWIRISLERY